ncbi:hypothetical protein [Enterococcus sp. DIV1420a]|uniref:hypothetical protein n=1 Tax=Enterococcus sp. DIV1420a TaxID=2774672 RepID=UPI003F1FAD36
MFIFTYEEEYDWFIGGVYFSFLAYILLLIAKVCHVEITIGNVQQYIDSFLLITSCLLLIPLIIYLVWCLLCDIFWGAGLISTTLLFLTSLFVLVAKLPAFMTQYQPPLLFGGSMSVLGYLLVGVILFRIFSFVYHSFVEKPYWMEYDKFAFVLICLIKPICYFALYVYAYQAYAELALSPACVAWSYLLFFICLCIEGALCLFYSLSFIKTHAYDSEGRLLD